MLFGFRKTASLAAGIASVIVKFDFHVGFTELAALRQMKGYKFYG